MKPVVFILAIILSGCSIDLDSWEMELAIKACEGKDNISKIVLNPMSQTIAVCKNGKYHRIIGKY